MKRFYPIYRQFHKTFTGFTFLAILALIVSYPSGVKSQNKLTLWYDEPADSWMTEALPIGNGYMGVMFFGGIDVEHIQFTEGTLWSGGPGANPKYNFGIRENANRYLPEVRRLLKHGKYKKAHALANRELTGIIHKKPGGTSQFGDFGAQQTMGDLYIEVEQSGKITDYRRELDLKKSVGRVSYQAGNVSHSRIYFGSYPRRTLVYHFQNSAPGGTTYRIWFETPHVKRKEYMRGHTYVFRGKVANNGMKFGVLLGVRTKGGDIHYKDGKIVVTGAQALTLLHTAATNYVNDFPDYCCRDYQDLNDQTEQSWAGMNWKELLKEHVKDYRSLFARVSLYLGGPDRSSIPTDERLRQYTKGVEDHGLEALYFQYVRYLMISGSRPGTLPLNLQGKWNNSTNPPWASDYHMNINLQMIYWPAEVTNLPESHQALFDYIESLVKPGQLAAREFFGTRGWVVNTMNNIFGYTSPGWQFPWGFFPGGAAWLSRHLWEHYAFTQDKEFLRETAYPIMKKAALFWIDYLVEGEKGYLVSMPSYSPEHGGISIGATMDHEIAWDILNNTVKAAKILQVDEQFRKVAARTRDRIYPLQIGRWGQLQEWKRDLDDPNDHHRHVSHLYALYPGHQISVYRTPKLAEAARTSLEARGDGGTGWSLAWKINFWARLRDGDHAYKLLQKLLQFTRVTEIVMNNAGGTYPNLLAAHPPFQLDGNMGAAAGIAEMLLQSYAGHIRLLPALPDAWDEGYVKGLRARGDCTVDISWAEGRLESARIQAHSKGVFKVSYEGKTVTLKLDAGESQRLTLDSFK